MSAKRNSTTRQKGGCKRTRDLVVKAAWEWFDKGTIEAAAKAVGRDHSTVCGWRHRFYPELWDQAVAEAAAFYEGHDAAAGRAAAHLSAQIETEALAVLRGLLHGEAADRIGPDFVVSAQTAQSAAHSILHDARQRREKRLRIIQGADLEQMSRDELDAEIARLELADEVEALDDD